MLNPFSLPILLAILISFAAISRATLDELHERDDDPVTVYVEDIDTVVQTVVMTNFIGVPVSLTAVAASSTAAGSSSVGVESSSTSERSSTSTSESSSTPASSTAPGTSTAPASSTAPETTTAPASSTAPGTSTAVSENPAPSSSASVTKLGTINCQTAVLPNQLHDRDLDDDDPVTIYLTDIDTVFNTQVVTNFVGIPESPTPGLSASACEIGIVTTVLGSASAASSMAQVKSSDVSSASMTSMSEATPTSSTMRKSGGESQSTSTTVSISTLEDHISTSTSTKAAQATSTKSLSPPSSSSTSALGSASECAPITMTIYTATTILAAPLAAITKAPANVSIAVDHAQEMTAPMEANNVMPTQQSAKSGVYKGAASGAAGKRGSGLWALGTGAGVAMGVLRLWG